MIRNVNTDLAAGILGLALSVIFWSLIDPEIMYMSTVFPKAMIIITGIVSILLFIKGLSKTAERSDIFNTGSNVRILTTVAFFFGWAVLIGLLGFFASSVVAMSVMVLYLAKACRKVGASIFTVWVGIVICEVAFFYLTFTRLLYVPLPEGWFF